MSVAAANFFSPMTYETTCKVLGRVPEQTNRPFDDMAFMEFLDKTSILPEARRHRYRINELLWQLANSNMLTAVGPGRSIMGGGHYYFMLELTMRQKSGLLWLTSALGFDFLHHHLSSVVLQITGKAKNNDVHAGSGFAILPNWVLTCAHVAEGMTVDRTQRFHGNEYEVQEILSDHQSDVGLLKVTPDLPQVPGVCLRDPRIGEPIVTLGYPRIPMSLSPALLMHKGEVTASELQTYSGHSLFLYSAVARPGNSGGPILAQDGALVGIVSDELSEQGPLKSAPFYAGVRTSEIRDAVSRMEPSIVLPVEDYA